MRSSTNRYAFPQMPVYFTPSRERSEQRNRR